MNVNELKNKDAVSLKKDLGELQKKLADIRFNLSAQDQKSATAARAIRKDIARILTVLNSNS